jgi:dTDP-4-dehydrorhamnose reductase
MRILITGASGLLGLNLALEAAKQHLVYGTVNSQQLQTQAFKVVQSDLLAPGAVENLLEATQPNWVIHCAALANLDACEANPALAEKLNTWLPGKMAQYVARGGARLVHISTDAVFDGLRGHYIETDLPNPQSTYARTKLLGEQAVVETNPDAIIVRTNLYGWSLTGKRSLAEFFFYKLTAKRSVPGFTDVFFCPLLVNQLAHILLRMLEKNLSGLYHVVCSQSTSKYEFGMMLARKFGLDNSLITPSSINLARLKAARSPHLTLQVDKVNQALGESMPDLSSGLEHFYKLYQLNYPAYLRELAK